MELEIDEGRAKEIAKLLANQFIARPDVKARQSRFGAYSPDRTPITMADLVAHIQGKKPLGHYMVNTDDTVKLFAFDVDLEKLYPEDHPAYRPLLLPSVQDPTGLPMFSDWQVACPRTVWASRKQGPARNMMRLQMRTIAHELVRGIEDTLGVKALAAYSGSKGIHVYGFCGKGTPAKLAREGAQMVLEDLGWKLHRGQNVYVCEGSGMDLGDGMPDYHQYTLEVYPKQDSLEGKDLGNLMRLPLGINYKSAKDGAFFIDMRTALTDMAPMDPLEALTTKNIWAYSA